MCHPLSRQPFSAWRELEVLTAEHGLTWVVSEGKPLLRSSGPMCQPHRKTDRQTRTMWAESGITKHLEGTRIEASQVVQDMVAQSDVFLKQRRLSPELGKPFRGERKDGRGEHMGLGQAFWVLEAGQRNLPHTNVSSFFRPSHLAQDCPKTPRSAPLRMTH